MEKISFNSDWKCFPTGVERAAFAVTLPHDAMQLDQKSENSPGGVNTGWYMAKDYTYTKTFFVPKTDQNKCLLLEFEGIYHKATIYLNRKKVAFHNYGYTGFFVDISADVRYGAQNEVRVEVINSDQPNSRWYSGTGIYRPVWLIRLPQTHILPNGIRITTLDWQTRKVLVEVKTNGQGTVAVQLLDGNTILAEAKEESVDRSYRWEVALSQAELWNPDNPKLYTCKVRFGDDVWEESFGIRQINCDHNQGFAINGQRVILRGACIHHDNGLLGACAYDYAEERKIRILKEQGYNSIRSAHNPCSKALLNACDKLGMLVMDEYVDVWYTHKTKYDYATEVEANYRQDLKDMVDKDYNHPSVIMYSTGNEVSESAQKRGIKLCGDMTAYLHQLDSTRPVSCGINIFFNFLSTMGAGVYSDKKADQAIENIKKKKAVGSEFYNHLAGLLGADFMKIGATLYPCDLLTKDAFANLDVAGYNYGIKRYEHDLKKYPGRLILGSETFCSDAARFWDLAKKEPRLIGDFVWAGMDYLGEVGIGSWEYKNYAPDFSQGPGWVSAGSGRIDLTGKPLAEMAYTRVAFELDPIAMAVVPVCFASEHHSPSAWKMSNAIQSWNWQGCEGMKAKIEVYARGELVSLFLNGRKLGTKKIGKDCRVTFTAAYQPGELKAVSYNSDGIQLGEIILNTGGKETILKLVPEESSLRGEHALCYVRLKYTDLQGQVKPMARGDIQVRVKGGKLLGLGSACPYYPRGYLSDTADTYYGEALAIIKPDGPGTVSVNAISPYGAAQAEMEVR